MGVRTPFWHIFSPSFNLLKKLNSYTLPCVVPFSAIHYSAQKDFKQATMSINVNTLFSLLEGQVGRDALSSAMLAYLAPAASVASVTPVKKALETSAPLPSAPVKVKKERAADAPKRAPTEWLIFSGRVRSLIGAETAAKVPGKVWTQVSSSLKAAGLMSSATDEQILAAYKAYLANPPEQSKAFVEGRSKAAKKAKADAETASTSSSSVAKALEFSEPAAGEGAAAAAKPKRQGRKKLVDMTAEELEAHNAKKLTKKAALAPLPPSPKLGPAEDVMDFEPFVWKKLSLLKNARGDVLTEEMEWFGRFEDGKMDTDTAQPSDLII